MIFSLNKNSNNLILVIGFLINDVNISTNKEQLSWETLIPFILGNSKIKLYTFKDNGILEPLSKFALNFEDDGYDKSINYETCKLYAKNIANLLKISPSHITEISLIIGSSLYNPENPDFIIKTKEDKEYQIAIDFEDNLRLFWNWLNMDFKDWEDKKENINKILNYWIYLSFNHLKPDYRNDIYKILKENNIYKIDDINWDNYYKIKTKDFFGIPINSKKVRFNQFSFNKILYLNAIYNPNAYFNYGKFIKNWKSLTKNYIFENIIIEKIKEGFYRKDFDDKTIFDKKVYYISNTWIGKLKYLFDLLQHDNKIITYKYDNKYLIINISLNDELFINIYINPNKFIFYDNIIKFDKIEINKKQV